MSRKIVLGFVAVVSVAACVFLVAILVGQGLVQASLWAAILAALAGVAAVAVAVWALPRPSKVLLPPGLEVPGWVVDRPVEMASVVKALLADRARATGITVGLYGAGGFGKTTLAKMVCADPRVRRRFGGWVYLVTVGRDVRGAAAVAAKVNDVIKLVSGENATFTDPQLAGQHLGSLLDAGARRLLVLDDVWEPEQLAPLTEGGKRCARLVTTRVPELLAGRASVVKVDQMSPEQARALLAFGLPTLDPAVADGLLAVTGRWPLLLRLVNKILADYAQVAADVSGQSAILLERLRAGGPAVVDEVLGDGGRELDVDQPQQRAKAVRATIGASTSLLGGEDPERFAELGVFAEDETVPFRLVAQLWRATAGLDELHAAQVGTRLVQLALVSQATAPDRGITLHDVVRDFLRAGMGEQRLAELNSMLLDAASLPAASPPASAAAGPSGVAWWELSDDDRYLWDHLIEHLLGAGRPSEADAVAGDLRWVGARLERFGPAAPIADLSAAGTPRAARLRTVLTRVAHLLAPTEPAGAVVDVLHSRVASDPDWGPQVTNLRDVCRRPRLVNRWPLPDLPDPALLRVLTGHTGAVNAVAISPDGQWLASGVGGSVRIWDVASGQQRTALDSRTIEVHAVAVSPDGQWLASGGYDGVVLVWDVATGRLHATLGSRPIGVNWVRAVAVSPDGQWLASGSDDGVVRIWDMASGQLRTALEGHTIPVNAVAVSPDGKWLASGSNDMSVRIWDVASGQERAVLEGHTSAVEAVAVSSDGRWLASGGYDEVVRIWDVATGQQQAALRGYSGQPSWVFAVAVSPDGRWLASGGNDRVVRIWDVAGGQQRAARQGRPAVVNALGASPDGQWIASGGNDSLVRIWDVASGQQRTALQGHTYPVKAVAVSPDGQWLASGGRDRAVEIWDVASGQQRATLQGRYHGVSAVAVSPDGQWLASGGDYDGVVRIWEVATGQLQAALQGHPDERAAVYGHTMMNAVAVSPDGRWLAGGGYDGVVRIWDVATGQQRATLPGRSIVNAVAVSPDGRWLASGSADGMVVIWDMDSGQQRATLPGHPSAVKAVAASPDGRWLASGGADGTVVIWDVASGQAQALMRVDNGIAAATWLSASALAVGGPAGLYLFDFLTDTDPGAARAH